MHPSIILANDLVFAPKIWIPSFILPRCDTIVRLDQKPNPISCAQLFLAHLLYCAVLFYELPSDFWKLYYARKYVIRMGMCVRVDMCSGCVPFRLCALCVECVTMRCDRIDIWICTTPTAPNKCGSTHLDYNQIGRHANTLTHTEREGERER